MVLLLQHTLIYYILILLHIQSTLSSPTPRHRAPRNIAARPNAGGRFGATSDRGRDRHREKKPKAPPPAPVLKADAPPPTSAEALAGSAAQKNYDSAVAAKGALDNDIKASDRAMKKLRGAERSKMKAHIKQQKGNKKTEENAVKNAWKAKGAADAGVSQYRVDEGQKQVAAMRAAGDKKGAKAAEKELKKLEKFNKDNVCRSRGQQKCCGSIFCKMSGFFKGVGNKVGGFVKKAAGKVGGFVKKAAGKTGKWFKKYGVKIGNIAAQVGSGLLQGIASIAGSIPLLGAPFAMAASAVDIGMKGIVAATASGVGSFAHKMGAYYKRQGIGGGLAAEIAGIAGAALPGGAVAGTLANAALKVARVTTAVVSKVGSVTQKVVDHVKGPPKF